MTEEKKSKEEIRDEVHDDVRRASEFFHRMIDNVDTDASRVDAMMFLRNEMTKDPELRDALFFVGENMLDLGKSLAVLKMGDDLGVIPKDEAGFKKSVIEFEKSLSATHN